ncbi:hypothetical protein, partial [Luteimonas sp. e5]
MIIVLQTRIPMHSPHFQQGFMIVTAASALTAANDQVYSTLSNDIPRHVTKLVTGNDADAAAMIDSNINKMSLAFGLI